MPSCFDTYGQYSLQRLILWKNRFHYGSGSVRCRFGEPMAFPISCCRIRGRDIPSHIPDSGRKTGKSALGAFEEFGQKYRFIGILQTIIPLIIVPYYCVITGWVMKYAFDYLTGSGSELSQSDFFGDFTQFSLDGVLDSPFIWFILVSVIVMLAVSRGVEKGVERISKVLMPILLVLLVGLCVYTFTIPGIWDGLKYYLYPDFSHLSASTFLGAIGQLFYSMSLAMGIMIAYGSYMKKDIPI